jgi:hypothetical protein
MGLTLRRRTRRLKIVGGPIFRGLKPTASAPLKTFDRRGASPREDLRYEPVTESNCVAVRRGGEQLEVNDQSVG